jgi:subtilisin family serine protease
MLAVFASLLAAGIPAASASSERARRYIVVLEDSVQDPRAVGREHSRSHNARIGHVYEHALKGYSAMMSDVAAARIASDHRVSYVEADGVVHKVDVQESPTWGLDRVDQRNLPLDASYTYNTTGSGVRAYIIDTGISSHTDFLGRVSSGYDFVDDDADSSDCDGHGTHVAGTVAGKTYGVAKSASLVGVRVLDCNGSGTWSGVIAGVDWVTANHVKPAVANMSLGGGASSSVDQAVAGSIAEGVTYAIAAGNGNQGGKAQDACNYSPARVPAALTVGATNSSDTKASWSNYGTCLDLFAPGVSITSTTMSGGTATWSGTSMATPHVAGVAALYLEVNPTASAAVVSGAITGGATAGVVGSRGSGSPNLLLYSLLTAPEPPSGDPAAPVATDDAAETTTDSEVKVDVLVNDTDANGDPLTVTNLTQPAAGGGSAAYSDADKTVTYTAPATPGTYSFTYTANDGTSDSNIATATVTVTEPAPPPAGASTATVGYRTSGGRLADKHLAITVVLTDSGGNPVGGAALEVLLALNGSPGWVGTGTTLSDGSVTWELKNASSGTYSTSVTKVSGEPWTGTTLDPGFVK